MSNESKPLVKKNIKAVKSKKNTETSNISTSVVNTDVVSQLLNNNNVQLDSSTLCKIDNLNDEIKLLKDQLLETDQEIDALFMYEYEKKMKHNYLKKTELKAQIKHKVDLLEYIKLKGLGNLDGAYKLLSAVKS
jgi:hypothetical protein